MYTSASLALVLGIVNQRVIGFSGFLNWVGFDLSDQRRYNIYCVVANILEYCGDEGDVCADTMVCKMTVRVRIMYWKEIPAQLQAEDGAVQVSRYFDKRFQEGIDAVSMFDGSGTGDEYLSGWEWGQYSLFEGSVEEAADTVADRFNKGFPQDFVTKIRDKHRLGIRDTRPGSIDHWIDTKFEVGE